MATNPYFSNYTYEPTQELLEDLVEESIKMVGVDNIYIRRKRDKEGFDQLLREDDLPVFNWTFNIEMALKTVDAYEGDGALMSKFGVEFRDQIVFSVSMKAFKREALNQKPEEDEQAMERPWEGDLVYCPVTNAIYEIMYVNKEAVFYQAGKVYVWDLRCERYEHSNERFDTGIKVIDEFFKDFNYQDVEDIEHLTDFDPFANNEVIQEESDAILDFTNLNPLTPNGKW